MKATAYEAWTVAQWTVQLLDTNNIHMKATTGCANKNVLMPVEDWCMKPTEIGHVPLLMHAYALR